MRCHYVYDKKAGKVLIPGCWSVVHTDDMADCTCKPETFEQFEKEIYNKVLAEKVKYITELEKEVFRLTRILNKYHAKANRNQR